MVDREDALTDQEIENPPPELLDALFNVKTDRKPAEQKPAEQKPVEAKVVLPQEAEKPVEKPSDEPEVTVEDIPDEEVEVSTEPVATDLTDDTEIEVIIDEKAYKVPLKELKSNYSGEAAIATRIKQATEARKEVMQQAVQLFEANKAAIERLDQLDKHLQLFSEPDVDWNWLRANNPAEYAARREDQRQNRERQEAVRREAEELQGKQSLLSAHAHKKYLEDEAHLLLKKIPAMADPEKAKSIMGRIVSAAKAYGYAEQEVMAVTDSRVFVALHDAARYRELLEKKAGLRSAPVTTQPASSTVKMTSAGSRPTRTPSKARDEAILAKAKQSGNPDDVALTLLVPAKRRMN